MPKLVDPVQDSDRLAALSRCSLLDSPQQDAFNRLAELAASILNAPVALVSLVDKDRQFFVSCPGLPQPWSTVRETPLSHSFCQHAVRSGAPLVIQDARQRPEFASNKAIEDLGVVAYLGIPLKTSDGFALGSFCVIDHQPRDWQARDVQNLTSLATSVITEIELRGALLREQAARREAEVATQQAREAAESLEMIDRHRIQFLATLAHELRNPLAAIHSGVALLQLANGPDRDRVQEVMQRQVNQMTYLVDDLLDVARISEGKIELAKRRISLQQVVDDAAEMIHSVLQEARHRLSIEAPPTPIVVEADYARLVQVFCNLLTNACRYTPPGGHLAIRLDAWDDWAEVAVADNGVGIPHAELSRIFDAFTQVEEAGGKRHGGLGIGLTVVRRIVELHGGHVTASSKGANQGSEFRVGLPRAG